jgi:PAS domain S-box-containing protein
MDASRGVTVLHVSDNQGHVEPVAAALREWREGFEGLTARDAQAALTTLESRTVDCVVASYDLPDTDGIALLEAVRQEDPELPFLLLAEADDESVARRAISAGVTDYLPRGAVVDWVNTGESGARPSGDSLAPLAERIERAVEDYHRDQQVEALVDSFPGMAYRIVNRSGWPVEFVAGNVEELTGFSPAALESGGVSLSEDIIHPEDIDAVREGIRTQLAESNSYEVSYRIRRSDGTQRWVRDRGQAVERPGDGPLAFEGFVSDITEQVEREQELERYQQFLEHSPDTIAVLDEYMSVVYQSPNPPDLTHEPVQVVDEGGLFEHVHPEDFDRVGAAIEQLLEQPDSVVTVECRARAASGEWRWIEARGQNCLGIDPVDGILVSVRDVTQRKEREQELARYGETLETLQESTQRLLDASDPDEVAQLTMSSIETILEFEVAGMWLADDDRELLEPVAVTEASEGVLETVPTYTAADESLSWEAYSTNAIRRIDDMHAHEGRYNPETAIRSELIVPLGEYGLLNIGNTECAEFSETDRTLVELWAGTVTTVLERLDHEQELRDQEAEIARERDRLEALASVVSHDLRNPLHVATSRLELLADEVDSEHLQGARRALERMERLIEDLLVLAREGQMVHDPSLVDLGEIVEKSWATARTANATLVCETDRTVRADRGRLLQVFENLFRNATEHASSDVTITVGELPEGFYVEDSGPGIPESERDQVFESGYSTTDRGNGLGLSIVRQIVAAHGWEIRATEGNDGGARFEITGVELF